MTSIIFLKDDVDVFFLYSPIISWAVLSDEQMSKGWPFSLLNDEQMRNKVGVEHQPVSEEYG